MYAVAHVALVSEKARPGFEDVLVGWLWIGAELLEESADYGFVSTARDL